MFLVVVFGCAGPSGEVQELEFGSSFGSQTSIAGLVSCHGGWPGEGEMLTGEGLAQWKCAGSAGGCAGAEAHHFLQRAAPLEPDL